VFDIALALHACGSATDWAMLKAQQRRAAFIVSPCCIGKVGKVEIWSTSTRDKEFEDGELEQHGRQQQWMYRPRSM
jgi:hypothetical protein